MSARWGQGGTAAGTPAKRWPWATSTLVRASHGQRRTIPSRPARCRQATTPPTDHGGTSTRCAQPGRPATPSHSRSSAAAAPRTPEACPSGHLDTPDAWTPDAWTPDAWTPDARMLDVRSTGWTDTPTADRTRRTGQRPGLADVRTSSRPATPAGRPDLARVTATGALGHPRRLRGDGTCAAALTAAATGQLPSTARHEAAPRRTALVCWSWMVRGEGNGTTERCGVRGQAGRECGWGCSLGAEVAWWSAYVQVDAGEEPWMGCGRQR